MVLLFSSSIAVDTLRAAIISFGNRSLFILTSTFRLILTSCISPIFLLQLVTQACLQAYGSHASDLNLTLTKSHQLSRHTLKSPCPGTEMIDVATLGVMTTEADAVQSALATTDADQAAMIVLMDREETSAAVEVVVVEGVKAGSTIVGAEEALGVVPPLSVRLYLTCSPRHRYLVPVRSSSRRGSPCKEPWASERKSSSIIMRCRACR